MKSEIRGKMMMIDCGTGDCFVSPVPNRIPTDHLSTEEVVDHLKRWLKDERLISGDGE